MARARLTEDEYEIQACYNGVWECVTTEPTFKLAREQKRCYQENDPGAYRIKKKRVRLEHTCALPPQGV